MPVDLIFILHFQTAEAKGRDNGGIWLAVNGLFVFKHLGYGEEMVQ